MIELQHAILNTIHAALETKRHLATRICVRVSDHLVISLTDRILMIEVDDDKLLVSDLDDDLRHKPIGVFYIGDPRFPDIAVEGIRKIIGD